MQQPVQMKFCLGGGRGRVGAGGVILVDMHTGPFFYIAITWTYIDSALSCQIYNQTLSAACLIMNIS